jgi:solute:Na+ symporter, SSS family
MTFLDWSFVAGYLLFALGVGVFLSRRASENSEEFFLGGRNLPWWMVGTSMVATTFAADTPLAITEMVRGHGIWRNWWWWNIALGSLLGVFLFSRLWRRAMVLTDNELIELRYSGRPAAFLRAFKAGWFATVYNFIVMGWVINGMSTVIAVLTDVDPVAVTWLLVVIAVIYTILSGFHGVVVTDLVQFGLAMLGSILLAVKAVDYVGGMEILLEKLNAMGLAEDSVLPDQLLSMVPQMSTPGTEAFLGTPFFTFLVFISLMWWSSHNADGGGYIIQRMASCRNEDDAHKATLWFTIANFALRIWPWVVVALVSLVLFPVIDGGHKLGYPMVLDKVLGPGLKGLLVTTFLAAFMSTIDTHLNWGASYLVNDIYKRFINPLASEKHLVRISRLAILLLISCAAFLSFFMTSIEKAWIFVWAMSAGIGAVLILRWFWWRINAWSEITALGASILVAFGLEILAFIQAEPGAYHLFTNTPEIFGHPLGTAMKAIIVVPIALVSWLLVTFLTRPEPEEHLVAFYKRVRPGGAWGRVADLAQEEARKEGRVLPEPVLRFAFLRQWLGGVALVYGLVFGIGHIVLLSTAKGLALLALAGLGGMLALAKAKVPDLPLQSKQL